MTSSSFVTFYSNSPQTKDKQDLRVITNALINETTSPKC